jgi:hypothetical protein
MALRRRSCPGASRNCVKRSNSADSATRASSRASEAPRQKCATAKAVVLLAVPTDVEVVRSGMQGRVVVGRQQYGHHRLARLDRTTIDQAAIDALPIPTHNRRVVAQHLLDGGRPQLGVGAQPRGLFGMPQ